MKRSGGKFMKKILILGVGCARCEQLEKNARKAVAELAIEADIGHVTEFDKIIEYGVTGTPALVIDQKVVGSGRILSIEDIKEFLAGK